ncbi:MAG: CopD family protein [Myxococcota bacterium]
MSYLTVKALHLVGVVAWFAGLFYMPRPLIYHVEAGERPEPEKTIIQEHMRMQARRLWFGITWPAMLFTLVFGLWTVTLYNQWSRPWVHVKLTLVALLVVYHLVTGWLHKRVMAGTNTWSSTHLRLWNEIATVHLILTVMVASLKEFAFHWTVPVGIIGTIGGLTAGVMIYKRIRMRNEAAKSEQQPA